MKKLLSPIMLGNLRLKNRLVMPAMHMNYTPEGIVTERLIAFYEERAKGGVALIIIGGCIIDEYSGEKSMINIGEDRYLPGLQRLADALHRHGAAVAAQLYHAGRYANFGDHSFSIGRQPLAPSPIPTRFSPQEPREMTRADIQQVLGNYAKAAKRVRKAGFDAIEILASAGYLICQFLSPLTNQRKDEYGGSFENRMRFGLEVADAVRGAVGKDFPVLIRLAGNDFMPGGNTNKECRLFAAELEKHGIDAFNITGGWHETKIPQITMGIPHGAFAYLAKGVKQVVTKPVIACNRMCDPFLADQLIEQGSADLVGIARGLIADPEMPRKLMDGRFDELNRCIGCNQGCFDHVFDLTPIECMINPRAGHELEIPEDKKAAQPKKVMVIGGGPGGLWAAKTAAAAGHKVTLYEKSNQWGGQLRLAGALEDRREFVDYVDRLVAQAENAGVDLHLNKEVDERFVRENLPDVLVVATGGAPIEPSIPGIHACQVVQAWDVLARRCEIGKEVVVIGGGAVGIEVAVFVAKMGVIDAETLQFLFLNNAEEISTLWELSTRGVKKVTLIEMMDKLGRDIGISTRWVALQRLSRYGVEVRMKTKAKEITAEGVIVEKDGKQDLIRCNTVILAVGTRPVNSLAGKLNGVVKKVITIGDAQEPRKAYEAIREGFKAGREI